MSTRVLVTGGAGYKGIKIAEALLARGHKVTVLDTFYFGYAPILHLVPNPNLSIVRQDVRDDMKPLLATHDAVIHLAGLSGFPACAANPSIALTVNVEATATLAKAMSKDQLLIFASTTALYEVAPDGDVDENTKVAPKGIYTKSKREGELICLNDHPNTIALRLATVMGVAPRMRSNLLVNDFVYRAIVDRSLVLYDGRAKRTFLHINDTVTGYMLAIDKQSEMSGGIYNVGSGDLNFSKEDVANNIRKYVECDIISSKLADHDARNFNVSFAKIKALGFQYTLDLDTTIQELVKLYRFYRPSTSDAYAVS